MMKLLSLISLFILVLSSLSGCAIVPISGKYYEPTASEGDVQGYGDWYAPTTLVLKRGKDQDIIVEVSGYFLSGPVTKIEPSSVEIQLTVPVGKTLRTDLSALRVYGDSSDLIGKISPVYAMNRYRMHADLRIDDATQVYSGNTLPEFGSTLFYTNIEFKGMPPKVLKIELPAMEADGISYPPLTVTFTYTHGWWWQYYGP